ncbi:MAG: acyltransferase family protein, partial [Cellulomonadaceae bacterium]
GSRSWIGPTNTVLADAAAAHPNVVLADWAGTIQQHTEDLAADGIHPDQAGAVLYAQALQDADSRLREAMPGL